jgi:hypothetical protein
MNKRIIISLCALGFLLNGCSSQLSQSQCEQINWQQLGETDGSSGQAPQNIESQYADCTQYGITINTNLYQIGWKDGQKIYCGTNNALQLGLKNTPFTSICTDAMLKQFLPKYRKGLVNYWQEKGENDGKNGVSLSSAQLLQEFNFYRQKGVLDTKDINENFPTDVYKHFLKKGLQTFCTEENGIKQATTGKPDNKLCNTVTSNGFEQGYQQGLQQYCEPSNTFALGRAGKGFPPQCPTDASNIVKARNWYNQGYIIYQRLENINQQIANINETIEQLNNEITPVLYTIRQLSSTIAQNKVELTNLENYPEKNKQEIQSVKQTILSYKTQRQTLKQGNKSKRRKIKQLQKQLIALQEQQTQLETQSTPPQN